jgi:hypothetical protein
MVLRVMNSPTNETLKRAYQSQLVAAGVALAQASQAAAQLSQTDLELISEIWPAWGSTWRCLEAYPVGSYI